ncbi:MAG: hypothetical protein ACLU0O_04645 [Collinsella sp.]
MTLNGSVVMGAKLAKHELFGGLCFGANAGFTTGNSSSESTEYGGTVDNLPEAAQGKVRFCVASGRQRGGCRQVRGRLGRQARHQGHRPVLDRGL